MRTDDPSEDLGALLAGPQYVAGRLSPSWVTRPHTQVIAEALQDAVSEPGSRTAVITPPQCGKSTLCSIWAPFWLLMGSPGSRIITTSYGQRLAERNGRAVRNLVRDHGHRWGRRLAPDARSVSEWYLTQGGGILSAGVGAGITGFPADCISEDVSLTTSMGPVPIGEFVASGCRADVLSYNHDTGLTEWQPVEAARVIEDRPLVEVVTQHGRKFRCTPDHRVYVPDRGYTAASELRPGDPIVSQLRQCHGESREDAGEVLLPEMQDLLRAGGQEMPSVRGGVPAQSIRLGENGSQRDYPRMLVSMQVTAADERRKEIPLSDLRNAPEEQDGELVLLRRLPSTEGNPQETAREGMHRVRNGLPTAIEQERVLHQELRGPGALDANGGSRELALQGERRLLSSFPRDAPTHFAPRSSRVCELRSNGNFHHRGDQDGWEDTKVDLRHPPHQREPQGQSTGEPDHSVSTVPSHPPQVCEDAVAVVRNVRGEDHRVYDIQVAGNRNFFADQVLVHNCLIIDDVYKNRADAESPVVREGVWDWLSSSALTRLAPGAPIFMIGTLWTPNDPILRLVEQEGRVEEGGRWRVVHMPAIADLQLTRGTDPLGRVDGDPLTHPKIDSADRAGMLAHWEDKRSGVLTRDWLALYQGDPHPRDGALVSWEVMEAVFIAQVDIPEAGRTVVAVDPSGGGADEVGIIVASSDGLGGGAYLTHDYSGVLPVTDWPARVCDVAEEHSADQIILETNFGAGLVPQAVRTAWEAKERQGIRPAIRHVRALKGKILRAEPIAQEMAMGRVRVARGLTKLASQWTSYAPGSADSPGRLDASVYACMALLRPAVAGLVSERDDDGGRPPMRPARRIPGGPMSGRPGTGGRRIPGR